MEQKLAEFRARRKADNATKRVESTADQLPAVTPTAADPGVQTVPTVPTHASVPKANTPSPQVERETTQVEVSYLSSTRTLLNQHDTF